MEWRSMFRRRMDRIAATFLSGIAAEFEAGSIRRVKSGLAVAKARGRRLGRQAGVEARQTGFCLGGCDEGRGRSYRWIARGAQYQQEYRR
jgi:DNA invertase Pin-like site-specific DNA recombinase